MTAVQFPDAYLVGAPKAGSSALMVMMNQHPEIQATGIKETNFHCRDFDMPRARTESEYLQLCQRRPEVKMLIDGSILSMYSREAATSIHMYRPDAKILMVLRNPVEAIYAWHSQMVFTGNEPITDFKLAIEAEPSRRKGKLIPSYGTTHRCPELLFYSAIMNYAEQIPRFTALFPPDQILILTQEDLRRNAACECAKVFKFLRVAPFVPVTQTVNPNQVRRSAGLHRILKRLFAAPARVLLPIQLRQNLIRKLDRWNSIETPREKMSSELSIELQQQCRSQVEKLEELLGRSLKTWYA